MTYRLPVFDCVYLIALAVFAIYVGVRFKRANIGNATTSLPFVTVALIGSGTLGLLVGIVALIKRLTM